MLSLKMRALFSTNQRFVFTLPLLLLILLFSNLNVFAQPLESLRGDDIELRAAEFNGHYYTPPADWILEKMSTPTTSVIGGPPCSTINVTYIGFTPSAQAAFQAAVDIWETVLSSPVDIEIEATWEVLGPNILGSTGAYYQRNFTGAPSTDYYAAALANQIAGSDLDPANVDIYMSFSSVYDWYLGTDGNPASDEYDFVTVALHEIGHGLGFSSAKKYDSDTGIGSFGLGSSTIPKNYDRFLTAGAFGTALTSFSGVTLGNLLTGNNVYNNSPLAVAANGGTAPKMYAPINYAGGSTVSHWDEATYPAGNPQSLMTPFAQAGEANHNPGAMTIGLLEDLGWTICDIEPPINNLPCDALPIECGQTLLGSTVDATDAGVGDPFCPGTGSMKDVFYYFNAIPGTNYTVTVNGDDYDGVLVLYFGECGELEEYACVDGEVVDGGQESFSFYYSDVLEPDQIIIRTYDYISDGGSFSLSVDCDSPNDAPCDAIDIECNSSIIGNTAGATNSGVGQFSCSTGAAVKDVFYKFSTEPNFNYTVSVNGDNYDGVLALYSGSCGALIELDCADESTVSGGEESLTYESTGFTTLYIRTTDWWSSGGDFTLSLVCTSANQEPCEALPITCGQTIAGSTYGGIQSGLDSPECANGSYMDVFYTFNALPNTVYTVTVNGDDYDGVLVAYSGSCDGILQELDCADNSLSAGGEEQLTIEVGEPTPIIIRTYDYASNAGEFELSLDCEIFNDNPCNPLPINCGEMIPGNIIGASPSTLGSPSCASGSLRDVFYSFDAQPGFEYQLLINGDDYDAVIAVYSGLCDGTLTELECMDDGTSSGVEEEIIFTVTSTTSVLVRTYDWFNNDGSFNLSLNCTELPDCPILGLDIGDPCNDGNPNTANDIVTFDCDCAGYIIPQNDLCGNAQELDVNLPGQCPVNAISGTTLGASDETGPFTVCDPSDGPWPDVFYTFNSGDFNTVLVDAVVTSQTDLVVSISELCGGESFDCGIGGFLSPISVNPNTDYIVRVGLNLFYGEPGEFNICVSGVFDCPIIEANVGDACNDGDPNTINDTVNDACNCVGESTSASLSGSGIWTNSCGSRAMTIAFYTPGTNSQQALYNTFINPDGSFAIPDALVGTYDIYIKIDGYLQSGHLGFEMIDGANNILIDTPLPGDLNGDNGVNVVDFSILSNAFGSSVGDPNFNLMADLNCDGGVNIVDFSMLSANFGIGGAMP